MEKIDRLEGVDVDIEISLKEYGIAWEDTGADYRFYFGCNAIDNEWGEAEYNTFDFGFIAKNVNLRQEFHWVDFDAIESFDDMFFDEPLPLQVYTLLQYYGTENVFGLSYGSTLTYFDVTGEK